MPRLLFAVALICMAVAGGREDNICAPEGKYLTYYPGDCSKYYKCDNGQVSEGSCGWFYRFDEESDVCKFRLWFIGDVDCSKALEPEPPNPKPTNGPTTSGQTTTKATSSAVTTEKGQTTTKATSSVTTEKGTTKKDPSTPKPSDVTTTKGSTPKPNDVTTKKNAASSIDISLLLATLCSAAILQRQF